MGKPISIKLHSTAEVGSPVNVRVDAAPILRDRVRLSTTDDAIAILQHEIDVLTERVDNLIIYCNRSEFPDPGSADTLYLALDERAIFYWDDDNGEYVAVSGDLTDYYTKEEIGEGFSTSNTVASAITAVSNRVSDIEEDYLKAADTLILDCGSATASISGS